MAASGVRVSSIITSKMNTGIPNPRQTRGFDRERSHLIRSLVGYDLLWHLQGAPRKWIQSRATLNVTAKMNSGILKTD